MLSYKRVMELFETFLKKETCIEVLETKWGYVRLYYELPYEESFDAVLCKTPEELSRQLLDDAISSYLHQLELDRVCAERIEAERQRIEAAWEKVLEEENKK